MRKVYKSKKFWSIVAVAATIAFNAISGNKLASGTKTAISAIINNVIPQIGE